MKKTFLGFSAGVAVVSVLLIIFLATGLWERYFFPKNEEQGGPRVITPGEAAGFSSAGRQGQLLPDESLDTKVPMLNGETVISVLNRDSEEGFAEEQFAAFLSNLSSDRRVQITYISFDERDRQYKRRWTASVAATRPETITLFSMDIIGDRNNCIIVTGMNERNEHTMTIFRRDFNLTEDQPFNKIAEFQIDGSILIQETPRTVAYQQGITTGQSFNIAAYGQDNLSNNLLDQIETIYSYNRTVNQYEQARVSRIPGSQIEQRRLRELLSGAPGVFENFINDLWYYVSPQGTIDLRQYLYFDPAGKEIIFFGDEAQQIFHWQSSSPTRYGLYIRSQNISITTLLRFIDIELESLDSIKLRVVEDVRLRIAASTTWDGSYRRAGAVTHAETAPVIRPAVNAQYDSSWGRIVFNALGEYSIISGSLANAAERKGRYVFFKVDGFDLLEMRPAETADGRMVYKVNTAGNSLSLARVRLGTSGVQDLFEPAVILTPAE